MPADWPRPDTGRPSGSSGPRSKQGKKIRVFVDETRPFLQGARLTAYELERLGIPYVVIADSMAGWMMHKGEVGLVIVGADRIVRNGDAANKIGTYSVAVLAKENGVPFYVAAPMSTFDLSLATGEEIPIEERPAAEVKEIGGRSRRRRARASAIPLSTSPRRAISRRSSRRKASSARRTKRACSASPADRQAGSRSGRGGSAMDMSKRFGMIGAVVVLVLGFSGPCLSQDDQDLVIRTYLFKADIQGAKLSKKDLAAFLDAPPLLSLRRGSGGAGGDEFEAMGKMIGSLFRIPNIIYLTSADMHWHGEKENINEAVRYEIDVYPIQLYRQSISPNSVRLKVEAFRFEFASMSFTDTRSHIMREAGMRSSYQLFVNSERIVDPAGGIKWLDEEISVPIGSSIIAALPTDDRSIFIALKVARATDKDMEIGYLGDKIVSLIIGGTDPVCGKAVIKGNDRGEASELKASLVHKGEFYYFCSEKCLAEFQTDPDRYLKKAVFRRNVATTPAGTVAPRPKLAIVPELPPAAPEARRPMIGRVEFDLDEHGAITAMRAARSDGLPLDRTLREALDQWRFEPKTESGKPVRSIYAANISVSTGDTAGVTAGAVRPETDPGRPDILAKAEEYCRQA